MAADERFARIEALFGAERLARLQDARVAVFGLGGVGGSCVEALVRGGVGRLVLVDGDAVEPSNINRQALANDRTVGLRKVEAARMFAHDINPRCRVETCDRFVCADDAAALLDEIAGSMGAGARAGADADAGASANPPRLDCIIDCIDSLDTKVALAAWAQHAGVPIVSCMGTARKIDPARFEFADLYDTQVCPLCRSMRRKARAAGIERLTVLYSQEPPVCLHETPCAPGARGSASPQRNDPARETPCAPGAPGDADRKNGAPQEPQPPQPLGTASFVPPVAGMMLAGYAIRHLVGLPR